MHAKPNFDYDALYMYSRLPYEQNKHWNTAREFHESKLMKAELLTFKLTVLQQWRSQGGSNSQHRRDKPKL